MHLKKSQKMEAQNRMWNRNPVKTESERADPTLLPRKFPVYLSKSRAAVALVFPRGYHFIQGWTEVWKFSRHRDLLLKGRFLLD